MHNSIFLIVPKYNLFIDRLSIFCRVQLKSLLLYLERKEVLTMKNVSCFELYPTILDVEKVNRLLLEVFPFMHTSLNEDGGLDMYITKEEYLFVLNELSKLNNYALTMPDSIEESNTTLTSMPIECAIVERYSVLYDLMFEAEYITKEVDKNTMASDREKDGKYSDYLIGKKFSQSFDIGEEYQEYLIKVSKDL